VAGRIGSAGAVEVLAREAAHGQQPSVRARATAALGTVDLTAAPELSAAVIEALVAATRDRSSQVVVAAARALGARGSAARIAFARLLARFRSTSSSWIQSQVLPALVAIDAGAARPEVDASLAAAAVSLREAAVNALATYATDDDVATLSELASDDTLRIAAAAIGVLAGLPAERVPLAAKEAVRARITTRDVNLFFAVVTAAASLGWTDFLAPVSATYATWTGPTGMDGRMGVLIVIQALGTQADLPIVEQALDDAEKSVVEFAVEVYRTLTGLDVSDRIPLASRVTTETPDDSDIERALRRTVRLHTSRGLILLRMRREAPLTATHFVHLVEDGFYDGIEFHRVEPAFVVQGGDPTGSGFEGSDALIREEISSLEHHRGMVGIATAGKDTGSSQFFMNHTANRHLDGRFTIFAQVVSGMDVVDRIEVGDEIFSASAF
jgi:cyclophilin family peptidyl-prolyl cis-trans isomerase/HEAT repeat protein